jgi:hypothetical protein
MTKQSNGNPQLNSERDNQNNRTEKKAMLGKTKKVAWDKQRRNRSI